MRLLSSVKPVLGKKPPKSGELQKYSPSLFAGWQKRWVELDNGILKYYKDKKGGEMKNKGTLNFDLYFCTVTQDGRCFKITFKNNDREFWFRASDEDEAGRWVSTIFMHIRESKGFKE